MAEGSSAGDTALMAALTGPETSGPRLILEACSPFKVLLANPSWCDLMGYSADDVVGNSVALLHGPLTCCDTLNALEVAMRGTPKPLVRHGRAALLSLSSCALCVVAVEWHAGAEQRVGDAAARRPRWVNGVHPRPIPNCARCTREPVPRGQVWRSVARAVMVNPVMRGEGRGRPERHVVRPKPANGAPAGTEPPCTVITKTDRPGRRAAPFARRPAVVLVLDDQPRPARDERCQGEPLRRDGGPPAAGGRLRVSAAGDSRPRHGDGARDGSGDGAKRSGRRGGRPAVWRRSAAPSPARRARGPGTNPFGFAGAAAARAPAGTAARRARLPARRRPLCRRRMGCVRRRPAAAGLSVNGAVSATSGLRRAPRGQRPAHEPLEPLRGSWGGRRAVGVVRPRRGHARRTRRRRPPHAAVARA
eukprot:7377062-Prymnesium_polylepis.1